MAEKNDGFREYRLKILGDISRLSDMLGKLQDITAALALEVGQIKIKVAVWGSIAGFAAGGIIATLIKVLVK